MKALKELMLAEPRWTLAAAESVTCGQIQAAIGALSGASNFFVGGITAYTLEQKARHLGVDRAAAEPVNCVSREVAEEMAKGVCSLFGTTWAVATTGYAEPAKDRGVDQPMAWWAIYFESAGSKRSGTVRSGQVFCPGAKRVEAQRQIAEAVLGELVEAVRAARAGRLV